MPPDQGDNKLSACLIEDSRLSDVPTFQSTKIQWIVPTRLGFVSDGSPSAGGETIVRPSFESGLSRAPLPEFAGSLSQDAGYTFILVHLL